MFGLKGIGMGELILILIIALVVFGPSKLPAIGKSMGEAIREFRGTVDNVEEEIKDIVNDKKEA